MNRFSCQNLVRRNLFTRQYATTAIARPSRSKAAATKTPATKAEQSPAEQPAAAATAPIWETDEAEALNQIDRIVRLARKNPAMDPWNQPIPPLDVQFPYSANFASRKHYATWREMRDQVINNRINDVKNAAGIYTMAISDSFAGHSIGEPTDWEKIRRWPKHLLFDTKSVKQTGWLSGIREQMLESYINLNRSVASQNVPALRRHACDPYLEESLKSAKRHAGGRVIWQYHGEVTPTRVLSIRATEGYLDPSPPKFGNRLIVHALVKFDTMQSIEVYDENGTAVHKPRAMKPRGPDRRVFAEEKRVTEYMLMEKRMWYDRPWLLRQQMYPTSVAPVI